MLPAEIVTLVVAVLVGLAAWQRGPTTLAPSVPVHVPTLAVALPLLLLWALSPVVAHALSAPALRRALRLAADERDRAMRYALFHWRFFERFVGEETQWLAPDNYQETPEPIVALRTSPTNIGLQLLEHHERVRPGPAHVRRDDRAARARVPGARAHAPPPRPLLQLVRARGAACAAARRTSRPWTAATSPVT